jgi:hypothetical protein
MKSLFDKSAYEQIISSSASLAHYKEAFKVLLNQKSPPNVFALYLFGWLMENVQPMYKIAPPRKYLNIST